MLPKACAYRSANLEKVDYYRGEQMLTYDINEKNPDELAIINLIQSNAQFYCQDGSTPG